MKTKPNSQPENGEQARRDLADVALRLAERGFYVMGALFPEEVRTPPSSKSESLN